MELEKLIAEVAAYKPVTFRRQIIFAGRKNPVGLHHVGIAKKLIAFRDGLRAADPDVPVHLTLWPIGAYGTKQQDISLEHHKKIVELGFEGLDVDEFIFDDLEMPGAYSATYDMQNRYALRAATAMREEYYTPLGVPSILTQVWHVIGADNADKVAEWDEGRRDLWRFARFIIIPRSGYAPKNPPKRSLVLDLKDDLVNSSSEIKRLIRTGGAWEHLVPPKVAAYIQEHSLYLEPEKGESA